MYLFLFCKYMYRKPRINEKEKVYLQALEQVYRDGFDTEDEDDMIFLMNYC